MSTSSKKIVVECKGCGDIVERYSSQYKGTASFCSPACRTSFYTVGVPIASTTKKRDMLTQKLLLQTWK